MNKKKISIKEKSFLTKTVDAILPFLIGGISGMIGTSVIQPIDMIKVRIQIKSEEIGKSKKVSAIKVIHEIYNNGGIKSFYKGLDMALIRQIFYATSRLGIYNKFFMYIKEERNHGANLSFGQKSICSLTAGFFGAFFGNPADLVLIRKQNDTTLRPEERRNYKNVFDAFSRIIKEEGVLALWRGCSPTVLKAMATNFGGLGPYDEVKERMNKWKGTVDSMESRLIASGVAGFLAGFLALPFDNAKTKMQKMKKGSEGKLPYTNIFDTIIKTVQREGVSGLWVGFPAFYFRIAPHSMIVLNTQDLIRDRVKIWREMSQV